MPCFLSVVVRSHACEVDAYGLPGGCSHICLLSSSYKTRTCRCRTGFNLGSDGRSCKSMLLNILPAGTISGFLCVCVWLLLLLIIFLSSSKNINKNKRITVKLTCKYVLDIFPSQSRDENGNHIGLKIYQICSP